MTDLQNIRRMLESAKVNFNREPTRILPLGDIKAVQTIRIESGGGDIILDFDVKGKFIDIGIEWKE